MLFDYLLVKAQAASNCKMVLGLLKNSTNRLMTPHSMTLSIGGFFSLESSLSTHQHRFPSTWSFPSHLLPELCRGVNLRVLVVAVDGLDHVWQLILKTIGGRSLVIVGIFDI